MPARLRLALLVATALATATVAGVIATRGSGGAAPSSRGFAGALRPPGMPSGDFALTDQDGHPVSLHAYRGQVVVLTFLYSTCRDSCPVTAQQIRGALDDLGRDVPALAVSVDPAHDTPDRARAFLARQHVAGRLRFLLGSPPQLAPVWRTYGIAPQGPGRGRAFDHSAYVLLLDRAGRQRVGFPVDQLTPEGLAHDLRLLLGESEPHRGRAPLLGRPPS
ncbi:MAG TPA: SCO family protein [Solirubrobacteraceae bacterium]|jgi:protein SCO1/2|nr:SCO family protein [Solirubrobacteraceae bacterium]